MDNMVVDLSKFSSYRILSGTYKKHDTGRKAKETEYGLKIIFRHEDPICVLVT
jgi:hypothetical protein